MYLAIANPIRMMTMNRVINIRAIKAKLVLAARNVLRLVGTKFQIRLYCRDKSY